MRAFATGAAAGLLVAIVAWASRPVLLRTVRAAAGRSQPPAAARVPGPGLCVAAGGPEEAVRRRMWVEAELAAWRARDGEIERAVERARRFLPVVRRILAEEGVPVSLAWLPLVESRFDPDAVSPAGAAGLWQLMPQTARELGLRVDGTVDERFDLRRSTRAAARYLARLHARFGDWHLAIAAYNAGETRLARALARTGASDFWALASAGALPAESRAYVPRFLAAAEILGGFGAAPAADRAGSTGAVREG